MPRRLMIESTGEMLEFPDGTPDEQILPQLQSRQVESPFGVAANLVRGGLQQYLSRPQSTLPNVSASSVLGLTPEQTQNTLGMIQQSNQDSLRQQMQQRQLTAYELQQEKDRQQQLKLEDVRMKNFELQQKHREKLMEIEAKQKIEEEKIKSGTPKASDYQLVQGADGIWRRVSKLPGGTVEDTGVAGRVPQTGGGSGGRGGAVDPTGAPKLQSLGGGRYGVWNPATGRFEAPPTDPALQQRGTTPKPRNVMGEIAAEIRNLETLGVKQRDQQFQILNQRLTEQQDEEGLAALMIVKEQVAQSDYEKQIETINALAAKQNYFWGPDSLRSPVAREQAQNEFAAERAQALGLTPPQSTAPAATPPVQNANSTLQPPKEVNGKAVVQAELGANGVWKVTLEGGEVVGWRN